MMTIFSLPKAFTGHTGVIQHNAIGSWARLGAGVEVILFDDDPGVAEAASEHGIKHGGKVARTNHGTPILKDAFDKAAQLATHGLLCYVNADIILMDDFLDAEKLVLEQCRSKNFLIVGRRWNLDITGPLDFQPTWQASLKTRAKREGSLLTAAASDYFVYRPELFVDMPPFAVGRTIWDNWLMYQARRTRTPLIDATNLATVIHQNHDYEHIHRDNTGKWKGPEVQLNFTLGGGARCYYSVYDATHVIRNRKLLSTLRPRYFLRHLQAWWWRTAVWFADRYP